MPTILIPPNLRKLTGDKNQIQAQADTVGKMIEELEASFPGMRDRIYTPAGEVRQNIAIYVNGEDIRYLENKETALKASDEVSILPAVAGG